MKRQVRWYEWAVLFGLIVMFVLAINNYIDRQEKLREYIEQSQPKQVQQAKDFYVAPPEITDREEISEGRNKDEEYVISFGANWCIPCLNMKMWEWSDDDVKREVMQYAGASKVDGKPYFVNVDRYPEFARKYGVTTIPCTLIVKKHGGKVVKRFVGFMDDDALVRFLR